MIMNYNLYAIENLSFRFAYTYRFVSRAPEI